MNIRLTTSNDWPAFFSYLDNHLSDNGKPGQSLFQPLSQSESCLNEGLKGRFINGMKQNIGQPGWRRLWLAIDPQGNIAGHIDIRGHAENHTGHRALLGMGVDRRVRKQGLGAKLLVSMTDWVSQHTAIDYIDLWVLSNNKAAIRLYQRCGFIKQGEMNDMFRIEGQSVSYTLMCKTLNQMD